MGELRNLNFLKPWNKEVKLMEWNLGTNNSKEGPNWKPFLNQPQSNAPFNSFLGQILINPKRPSFQNKPPFGRDSSIMVKRYPKLKEIDNSIEDEFNLIMEAIVSIRRCKVLVDKANQRVDKVYIKLSKDLDKSLAKPFITRSSAKVDEVIFIDKRLDK